MEDRGIRGAVNRVLQMIAKAVPSSSVRVALHRARGVRIGNNVWIGTEVILDTAYPSLITIEDNVTISVRTTVIAHFRDLQGVKVEHDVFIGAGALITPGVVIGHGAVVSAGSVVTRSVPPMTMVQGNPAIAVARCGIPLSLHTTLKEFSKKLKPLNRPKISGGEKGTERQSAPGTYAQNKLSSKPATDQPTTR